jgi:integrase
VFKRGNVWWVKVELDPDPLTGKRRYHRKGGFANKKEADAYRVQALSEIRRGSFVEPAKMGVGEFLDRWLRDYAEVSVRPSTLESYRALIRRHLIPALGNIPLAKLQPIHLQELFARKRQEGLSTRSVRYLYALMREALGHAVKWQLIGRNVAEAVDPPRLEKEERQVLTQEQAQALLDGIEDLRLLVPVSLALLGGLRRGECLGLRWEDVDQEERRVYVRQTLEYVPGRGLVFGRPKTPKSRRAVDMPAVAFTILRRWRKQQAQERLAAGPLWKDSGLVCTAEDGGPLDPDRVTKAFSRAVKALGLPPVTFHDLRHTHATLLFAQGTHPKLVQERLGHSQVGITLDLYSHSVPGLGKEVALTMDRIFRAAHTEQA